MTDAPPAIHHVVCKTSTIHMTVRADGKSYVMTSAIVCSNGKLTFSGKRES